MTRSSFSLRRRDVKNLRKQLNLRALRYFFEFVDERIGILFDRWENVNELVKHQQRVFDLHEIIGHEVCH